MAGLVRLRRVTGRTWKRGAVPGAFDGVNQVIERDTNRVEDDGRLLGRVIHCRLDALELVQLALDTCRAGRTGHAGDLEPDALGGRSRHQAATGSASYPASSIAATSA